MKQIHDNEFAALIAMPAPDRYSLFVGRVADWEEVWSLRSARGWNLVANDDGVEAVPVWPHKQFAEACADSSKQEVAAAIKLDDWLERWLPGLDKDGRQVAVFPIPNGKGIVVTPAQLKHDLLSECEQYE